MQNTKIRFAERRDCPRLLELIYELATYERAGNEVTISPEHFEASGFDSPPVWRAFVAEVDGVVHGFALYYIRFSTWKGQCMYLEDLLVTEDMRGKGIGKLLFDRLQKEAQELGYNAISWQVLEWNEPAINFYKKLSASFDEEWINCRLEIKSNPVTIR